MSITARIMRWLLVISGFKFWLGLAFKYPPQWLVNAWPAMLPKGLATQWREVKGRRIATLSPNEACGVHVVFLHGGGYALGFFPMFIRCVAGWVRDHGVRVSLLDYPLAPNAGVEDAQDFVREAYQCLLAEYPDERFCLVGDSAGGALALVQAQHLRDSGGPVPAKTVLISPWVDADMARDFSPWADREVLLTSAALQVAIDNYRGDVPLHDPRISPLYGGLDNLGEVVIVAGSGELFFPDLCRLREQMMASQGTSVLWFEGEGLWHDWVYFAIPEARQTRQDIGRWLVS